MQEKLNTLKAILAEVADLTSTAFLLEWDAQVKMPPGGAEGRSHQQATVQKLAHVRLTSPEVGRLLDDLQPHIEQLDPDSDEARLVRVTRRQFDKRTRVPAEMVAEFAQLVTMAYHAWERAKEDSNFAHFLPHLEKIVDNRRRYAELFAPYGHIYDPLLDDYEPGMKTAEVQAIFNTLRPQQVTLLKAIAAQPQVDDRFLYQPFDPQKQWDFGVEVITRFGYDWQRGRQDKSVHPFTIHFGMDDVRITTRIDSNFLNTALFGTMHEAGHAMYEQGVAKSLARSPLAGGASLGIHESQSRLWENLVGRSLPFWEHFYPRLQAYFPEQFGSLDLEAFYQGINRVEPSLIRVEADEATYNLHIMLRLELEIAMLEGALELRDLPQAWNARVQDYLGLTPPNDSQGVLQDIHWSNGYLGYFTTYALGNLVSLQLWERLQVDIPDLDDQIRQGEFSALLGWLRSHVHQYGSKFEPQELVQRITGSKVDPAPYMRYLQRKFGAVYGL